MKKKEIKPVGNINIDDIFQNFDFGYILDACGFFVFSTDKDPEYEFTRDMADIWLKIKKDFSTVEIRVVKDENPENIIKQTTISFPKTLREARKTFLEYAFEGDVEYIEEKIMEANKRLYRETL